MYLSVGNVMQPLGAMLWSEIGAALCQSATRTGSLQKSKLGQEIHNFHTAFHYLGDSCLFWGQGYYVCTKITPVQALSPISTSEALRIWPERNFFFPTNTNSDAEQGICRNTVLYHFASPGIFSHLCEAVCSQFHPKEHNHFFFSVLHIIGHLMLLNLTQTLPAHTAGFSIAHNIKNMKEK